MPPVNSMRARLLNLSAYRFQPMTAVYRDTLPLYLLFGVPPIRYVPALHHGAGQILRPVSEGGTTKTAQLERFWKIRPIKISNLRKNTRSNWSGFGRRAPTGFAAFIPWLPPI